ncbi:hypothetical protein AUEXF2481DRAFT_36691 [Aureobasidium subglaciale EXF-2481]|uniref:Uncharacterized protein n=1 Tax=Aureobasidium subglaciale (strain EXF-2481) TaxID=1043005 RepID=A0A074YK58_AURSE|nr:uncharacterized protein AUEXF2481DRAFT_36691 [Aureobasidium subglaciale EXF-2481]KEQ98178.1 hypothetical protein AUEXF2481DRAFT_36691 [Aureobasidium subglaciale EXF-2481]
MTSFEQVGVMVGRLQHFNVRESTTQQQRQAYKTLPRHIGRDKMVSLDAVMQCNKQAWEACSRTLDCDSCVTQQMNVSLVVRMVGKMALLIDEACKDFRSSGEHRGSGSDDALGQYSIDTLEEWLAVMSPMVLLQTKALEEVMRKVEEVDCLSQQKMTRSELQSAHRSVAMAHQLLDGSRYF